MILRAEGMTVRYRGATTPALNAVSCHVAEGELLAIAGPNGSGKSTLLRACLALVPVEAGQVSVLNRPLGAWSRAELARTIGVVMQGEVPVLPIRAADMVLFGRYARLGPLEPPRPADRAAVERALRRTDAWHLRDRGVDTLSGGEWQRIRLARALAQEPQALFLDEPTAALDIRHEMELLELLRTLVAEGLACVVVTHQLNLAARFSDRIMLLHEGRVAAEGAPTAVFTKENLSRVFDWPLAITTWSDGSPQVVPLRPAEAR